MSDQRAAGADPEEREAIRARFGVIETATVADVLDGLGHGQQGLASSIQGVTGRRVAGWAYTVLGQMVPYDGGGDSLEMEACKGVARGEVTVWSGQGKGVCYFGELIALGLAERGCVGSVQDGGVRDVRALTAMGFPVFATYRSSVQSIGRWKVLAYQQPISMPGATSASVQVKPGDFILGDDDGAIVIPNHLIREVLPKAEAMTETEGAIRKALSSGMSLSEALDTFGHV